MNGMSKAMVRDAVGEFRTKANGQVVLVFQGGGALGAYQVGVYQALHEAGVEPDWIIGTSIGAINAAIIAGNQPADRLDRLNEFWSRMEQRIQSRVTAQTRKNRNESHALRSATSETVCAKCALGEAESCRGSRVYGMDWRRSHSASVAATPPTGKP